MSLQALVSIVPIRGGHVELLLVERRGGRGIE